MGITLRIVKCRFESCRFASANCGLTGKGGRLYLHKSLSAVVFDIRNMNIECRRDYILKMSNLGNVLSMFFLSKQFMKGRVALARGTAAFAGVFSSAAATNQRNTLSAIEQPVNAVGITRFKRVRISPAQAEKSQ